VIPAVIVAVLALIVLVWILDPIRRGVRRDVDVESRHVEEAVAQKDAAIEAMVDIENERELGKLSDADFEALRAEYERDALAALRALETAETDDADDQLEAEIAAMKAQLGEVSSAMNPNSAPGEMGSQFHPRRSRAMTCPECGMQRTPGRPCPSCGSTS
jgi:rRNA maturation endonuclease Nob1